MKSSAALMLLAMLSVAACERNGPAPAASPSEFCRIAKPIYFDPADRLTDRTERAIISHNEQGEKLCQWQGAS